jgi:acetyl-CoA carboxylase beta subunit
MEKEIKHTFKRLHHLSDKILICPQCFEALCQTDIEVFSCCPYCNHHFETNSELEDYILKPVVDHWIRQYSRRGDADIEIFKSQGYTF